MKVSIPVDVPKRYQATYEKNWRTITKGTGRLMMFAGDQKVEHLNEDFYGKNIAPDDKDPEHLFEIASKAKIGCFAAQFGLIARYGNKYRKVPYLVKLNSKTNILPTKIQDPYSKQWVSVEQVVRFKKQSRLNVVGVGYTLYLGSAYEAEMLHEASQIIIEAHQNGLIAVLWIYPRGVAVKDEKDPHLIAGATGTALCLGADFVKVSYPKKKGVSSAIALKEAVNAAGGTGVICAGGSLTNERDFLQTVYDQIHVSGASGNATGRNIHQRELDDAIRFCNAIYAITIENKSVDQAYRMYKKK